MDTSKLPNDKLTPEYERISVLRCTNLYKKMGKSLSLGPCNLVFQRGQTTGLLGPNGAGKSTLLRLLSGLSYSDSGSVLLGERDIKKYSLKELSRWRAVLPQESLPPLPYTVGEVVQLGRYAQNPLKTGSDWLETLLERFELSHLANRSLDQLSGGERQRVALCKAMAQEPKILFLDEPTTYLDVKHQLAFLEFTEKLAKECGLCVIMVLHEINLAARFCEQLVLLRDGKVLVAGPRDTVLTPDLLEQAFERRPDVIQSLSGRHQVWF